MVGKKKEPEVDHKPVLLEYREKFDQFDGDRIKLETLWKKYKESAEENFDVTVCLSAYNAANKLKKIEEIDSEHIKELAKNIKNEIKSTIEKKLDDVVDIVSFEGVWKEILGCIDNGNKKMISLNKIKPAFKRARSSEGDTDRLISMMQEVVSLFKNEDLEQDPIFSMNPEIVIRGKKSIESRGISQSNKPLDSKIIDRIIETRINNNSGAARWIWELIRPPLSVLDSETSEEKMMRNELVDKYTELLQQNENMSKEFTRYLFNEVKFIEKYNKLSTKEYKMQKEIDGKKAEINTLHQELDDFKTVVNGLRLENESIKRENDGLITLKLRMKTKLDEISIIAQNLSIERDKLVNELSDAKNNNERLQELLNNEQDKCISMLSDLNRAYARVSDLENKITKESGGRALARMVKLTHNTLNDLTYFVAEFRDSEESNESMFADIILALLSDLKNAGVKNIGIPREIVGFDPSFHTYEEDDSIEEGEKVEIILPGWCLTDSDEVVFKAKTKRGR